MVLGLLATGFRTLTPTSSVGLLEHLMTIELDDNEARLLCAVVLEKAQEHFIYSDTSAVAKRLCEIGSRIRASRAGFGGDECQVGDGGVKMLCGKNIT
jgi:hypothetical protein